MAMYPLEIVPFAIPESVTIQLPTSGRREDGFKPFPTIAVADLPRETVIALCDEFKSRMLTAYEQAQRMKIEADGRCHHSEGFGGRSY